MFIRKNSTSAESPLPPLPTTSARQFSAGLENVTSRELPERCLDFGDLQEAPLTTGTSHRCPNFFLHSRSKDSVSTFCGEGISTAVNLLFSPRASHTATHLNCLSLMQPENPTVSFCRLQASSGYFSIHIS